MPWPLPPHRRSGQLFQNRYKSILCQEDTYLLELVRYIHLNPLRARLVADIKILDKHPFCGHAVLMREVGCGWQDEAYVLKFSDSKNSVARRLGYQFIKKGIGQDKRTELAGGGLIRRCSGWSAIKSMRKTNLHMKSDERLLGNSDFVERVLKAAEESWERKYDLIAKGYDLDMLVERVAGISSIDPEENFSAGQTAGKGQSQEPVFFLGCQRIREYDGRSCPATSYFSASCELLCAARGERIAAENGFSISGD